MIRLQSPFEWIDKVFGAQYRADEERIPPSVLSENCTGTIDLAAWEALQDPITVENSVAAPLFTVTMQVPDGEDWYVHALQAFHSDGLGPHDIGVQIVNTRGRDSGPFFVANNPVNLIPFGDSNALAAFQPAALTRPVLVRGGNTIRVSNHDAALAAGALTVTAIVSQLPPGSYIPGAPFG